MLVDPLVGKVVAGRFEVAARIGEGGYSVIYRANQLGIDREIALKVLDARGAEDPLLVERFHHAARALARVSHENAAAIYDSGHDGEERLHFIALELVDGTTLRRILEREGRLTPS